MNKISRKALLFFATLVTMTTVCAAQDAPQVEFGTSIHPGVALPQLTDGVRSSSYRFTQETRELTISPHETVSGLYLIWDVYPQGGYLYTTQSSVPTLQNTGYFQEYLPLPVAGDGLIVLSIPAGAVLCDIYAFGEGELPAFVHDWQPPVPQADILLLPTHADDEHLFFGGILPTYASNSDVSVQVAYMVNHATEPYRQQEMLNGLWEVGVRNYPVIPEFPDYYSQSLAHAQTVYDSQKILEYQLSLLERFRPQVVIGHDLKGEYGHGAHMLNADSLTRAAALSEFAPKKLYLHLYEQNPLLLDFSTPLPAFSGKTAFEMAVAGFSKHLSQQQYFNVEQSGPYDCRKFGLYHTLVGADSGNDLLENITPYRLQHSPQPTPEIVENLPEPSTPQEQQPQYLPEATNDRLFAVVGSPVGLALGATLAGLLLAGGLIFPFVRKDKRKR